MIELRVFKTRYFSRFAQKEKISDVVLIEAVLRAERGLIDADLGGGIIKQRVARKGQGRSGGYRALLAYRHGDMTFFVHGYAKNEQENVAESDLAGIKQTGRVLLNLSSLNLKSALDAQKLEVVFTDEDGL